MLPVSSVKKVGPRDIYLYQGNLIITNDMQAKMHLVPMAAPRLIHCSPWQKFMCVVILAILAAMLLFFIARHVSSKSAPFARLPMQHGLQSLRTDRWCWCEDHNATFTGTERERDTEITGAWVKFTLGNRPDVLSKLMFSDKTLLLESVKSSIKSFLKLINVFSTYIYNLRVNAL